VKEQVPENRPKSTALRLYDWRPPCTPVRLSADCRHQYSRGLLLAPRCFCATGIQRQPDRNTDKLAILDQKRRAITTRL